MLEKVSLLATKVTGVLIGIVLGVISIMWTLIIVLLTVDLFGWSLQTFINLIGGVI